MAFTIDLNNYFPNISDHVPPGRYRVRIEKSRTDQNSKGNPQEVLLLSIMEGEYVGAKIVDRLQTVGGGVFHTVNFLQALGLPTTGHVRVTDNLFLNRVVDVDLVDNEYRGSVSSQVQTYFPAPKQAGSSGGADLEDVADVGESVVGASSSGDAEVSSPAAAASSAGEAVAGGEVGAVGAVAGGTAPAAPSQGAAAPVAPQEIDLDMIDL